MSVGILYLPDDRQHPVPMAVGILSAMDLVGVADEEEEEEEEEEGEGEGEGEGGGGGFL
jgi:hypothetical protein